MDYPYLFLLGAIVALCVRHDSKERPVGVWSAIGTAVAVTLGFVLADLLVDYGWPLLRTTLGQALARPW